MVKINTDRRTILRWLSLVLLGLIIFFWRLGQYVDVSRLTNYTRDLPDPVPVMTDSVHINAYTEAWILYIENGSVQVETIDTKDILVFNPRAEDIRRFRKGSIAPITFVCEKGFNKDCDLDGPYKMFASNVEVKLLALMVKPR